MSKQKLFETINAPFSALSKLKIGLLVRETLPQILEMELISDSEIKKMTTSDYSKMVFDINYPVLKELNENTSILENRTIGDYTRYYAGPVNYKNTKYLISSEWYDRNQEDYIKWLKRKVKSD